MKTVSRVHIVLSADVLVDVAHAKHTLSDHFVNLLSDKVIVLIDFREGNRVFRVLLGEDGTVGVEGAFGRVLVPGGVAKVSDLRLGRGDVHR